MYKPSSGALMPFKLPTRHAFSVPWKFGNQGKNEGDNGLCPQNLHRTSPLTTSEPARSTNTGSSPYELLLAPYLVRFPDHLNVSSRKKMPTRGLWGVESRVTYSPSHFL